MKLGMDAGQLFALLIGVFFTLLGGFAAIATAQALEEGDRKGLGTRVFKSLTKTTVFLGFPGLVGLIVLLDSEARGGNSGIMSKNTGLFLIFLVGALALVGLWVCSVVMGFVASLLVRNLRPLVAAGVMLAFVAGAPVLWAVLYKYESYLAEQRRLHGHP